MEKMNQFIRSYGVNAIRTAIGLYRTSLNDNVRVEIQEDAERQLDDLLIAFEDAAKEMINHGALIE